MKNVLSQFGSRITKLVSQFGSFFRNAAGFFVDAFKELRNVTWLKAKDAVKFSTLVITFIAVTAGFIALLDLVFFRLFELVISS